MSFPFVVTSTGCIDFPSARSATSRRAGTSPVIALSSRASASPSARSSIFLISASRNLVASKRGLPPFFPFSAE